MTGEPTTVLVTGAMGQVGALVTELLLGRGRHVVALDLATEANTAVAARLSPGPSGPGRLTTAFADLSDREAVAAAVQANQPDAIIHLAAIVSPPCYRNPDLARRVNVDGTANLVEVAGELAMPPSFVMASSSAVYGSRNPHRHASRIDATTPTNPIDCYGEQKVAAEQLVRASGLRAAVLRIGGILSPEALSNSGPDYFLLMRATPRDNRVHMVDARDVALAFANAVDRMEAIDGKVLLIGGDDSYLHTHVSVQDEVTAAIGLGRLGQSTNLPGDPQDEDGWGLTDWFDTTETQQLLDFQAHRWSETLDWLAASQGRRRTALRALGPLLRPVLRSFLAVQRRREGRGPYADPWTLITTTYGPEILAQPPAGHAGSS